MSRLDLITSRLPFSPLRSRSASAASSAGTAGTTSTTTSTATATAAPDSVAHSPSDSHHHSSSAWSPVLASHSPLSLHRQPSTVGLEEERQSFGVELSILEPRPMVYWGGLEERLESPAE